MPCVGSDMPFIRHILISRGLGRVCRPGDTEDIARLVNEMLNDPDELQNMKRRCFEAARELCWEREGSNLLGEYERLATIEQVARA